MMKMTLRLDSKHFIQQIEEHLGNILGRLDDINGDIHRLEGRINHLEKRIEEGPE
jgi:hypothetical protein